jgi:NAD(P)-dependent dehydrogenase (short-subunit alcohol dehydrogenase family)
MVSLAAVQASNAPIPTALPPGLVAVFVGGTSGIGEYTLKEFARFARKPRIYNIGRSQEASDRIAVEVKELNANAQYTFIQADVSLIRTVDAVCDQIKSQEKAINILFMSAGTLVMGTSTYSIFATNSRTYPHTRNQRRPPPNLSTKTPLPSPLHPQPPPFPPSRHLHPARRERTVRHERRRHRPRRSARLERPAPQVAGSRRLDSVFDT